MILYTKINGGRRMSVHRHAVFKCVAVTWKDDGWHAPLKPDSSMFAKRTSPEAAIPGIHWHTNVLA